MPQISLRGYNQEIEALIDSGQTERAINHCLHILKTFPKHLDTYRLLGKAYLEAQRYDEAADILLRVLSCVPDDFISQIGLSIIREEQGNLDAAIHHMERAFEIQPANVAVQEELRRLYGHKYRTEPPKIRLTRGALVRMYIRGELYDQAVAEIEAAQKENSELVDLDILRARVNFMAGRKEEAAAVSRQVIESLPYCFEANRILSQVLGEANNTTEANIFLERVFAMEPHLAQKPANGSATEVLLERLDDEVLNREQTPAWVQSFGSDWKTGEAGKQTGKAEISEQHPDQSTKDNGPDSNLPDWMQAAGWTVAEEQVESPSIDEPTSEHIAPAQDIPDWVASQQSAAIPDAAGETLEVASIDDIASQEDALVGDSVIETETAQDSASMDDPLQGEQAPFDQVETFPGSSKEISPELFDDDSSDIPDWLRELAQSPIGIDADQPSTDGEETFTTDEPTAEVDDVVELNQVETYPTGAAAYRMPDMETEDENYVEHASSSEAAELPAWLKSALAEEDTAGTSELDGAEAGKTPDTHDPSLSSWSAEWSPEEWHSRSDDETDSAGKLGAEEEREIAGDLAWLRSDDTAVDEASQSESSRAEEGLFDSPEYLQAISVLKAGNYRMAAELYSQLSQDERFAETAVLDLRQAIERDSAEPMLWQMLGDALAHNNQLDEALQAYQRAEELLK